GIDHAAAERPAGQVRPRLLVFAVHAVTSASLPGAWIARCLDCPVPGLPGLPGDPLNLSGATTIFMVSPAPSIQQGDDRGRRVLAPFGQILELHHVVGL